LPGAGSALIGRQNGLFGSTFFLFLLLCCRDSGGGGRWFCHGCRGDSSGLDLLPLDGSCFIRSANLRLIVHRGNPFLRMVRNESTRIIDHCCPGWRHQPDGNGPKKASSRPLSAVGGQKGPAHLRLGLLRHAHCTTVKRADSPSGPGAEDGRRATTLVVERRRSSFRGSVAL
jgi:hypothetical protein